MKNKKWNKKDGKIFIHNLHCNQWICTFTKHNNIWGHRNSIKTNKISNASWTKHYQNCDTMCPNFAQNLLHDLQSHMETQHPGHLKYFFGLTKPIHNLKSSFILSTNSEIIKLIFNFKIKKSKLFSPSWHQQKSKKSKFFSPSQHQQRSMRIPTIKNIFSIPIWLPHMPKITPIK